MNTVCIIASSSDMFYRTIVNGVLVYEGLDYQEHHEEKDKNLFFMGEKIDNNENFTASLFGRMSDINLWNTTLSYREVTVWEECKLDKGGNIIDWETADWTSS